MIDALPHAVESRSIFVNVHQEKESLVSDQKSTSANAVTTDRWESLKREYYMRTHRSAPIGYLPSAGPVSTVADPNAE